MDADGTHPPELLPRMLATLVPAEGEPCDVVIASRYAPGGEEHGLPPLRRLYSALASGVLRVLAGIRGVRDYSCGYRLYGRAILDKAARYYGGRLVTERSFVCMAELLIKLGRRGARIAEVPLKLHYELKGGVSKMNVAATIRRYAVLAWRLLNDPGFR
jgi:dolichol-phosphate mannosyltransferase